MDKSSIIIERPNTHNLDTNANILEMIEAIKTNKNFSKLVIYSLNTIKSYLVVQNNIHAVENSVSVVKSKSFTKYKN
jgi:hypothetical protein